ETAARIPIGRNGDHIAAHDVGLMGDHSTLQTRVRRNSPLLSIARVHLLHNWFDLSGAGGLEILSRGIGGARRVEITPEREGSVPFWHNRILARSSSECRSRPRQPSLKTIANLTAHWAKRAWLRPRIMKRSSIFATRKPCDCRSSRTSFFP